VNDIAQSLGGPAGLRRRVVLAAADNLRGMVRRGKELGLRVALANVGPWNNGFPYGADRLIRMLDRLIAAIGRAEEVPVLPWYRTLNDPGNPGKMKPAWTADGDHPSVLGYRRLGRLAFRVPR
jgi:lysophospholipase L1-like esterase